MKSFSAILLVVLVAVVSAQVPFRCRSPSTWEAKFYGVEGYESRAGRIYYDAPGERISFRIDTYENGMELYEEEEYFFFKQRYGLRYNTGTKQCVRFNLTRPFFPIEVPPTAQYLDTHVIGSNADESLGVTVNVWAFNGNNGRGLLEFVADDGDGDEDCLPVRFMEFGGPTGSLGFQYQDFFNIVVGVNPEHFIPPEVCPRF